MSRVFRDRSMAAPDLRRPFDGQCIGRHLACKRPTLAGDATYGIENVADGGNP